LEARKLEGRAQCNHENTKLARRPCGGLARQPKAGKPLEGLPAVSLAGYDNTKEEERGCFRDEFLSLVFLLSLLLMCVKLFQKVVDVYKLKILTGI
jgi:hypothetical protein